jgi:hypothetical protein
VPRWGHARSEGIEHIVVAEVEGGIGRTSKAWDGGSVSSLMPREVDCCVEMALVRVLADSAPRAI